jgi:[ribosomal protein S5]-alanine N-acetyltransferase
MPGQIFDFSTFPNIKTDRLCLRQLTHGDAEAFVELFSSPEVLRFLSQPPTDTPDKAIELIDWFNDMYQKQDAVNWGITLRSGDHNDDRVIGMCGTYAWDRSNRRVDIGYQLLPAHWGRGYATEAAHAVIRWSFDNLDVHRVQADCTDGNIASERVLLKCGFKVEGIWRESCWEHGRFVDIKQFGLLEQEYRLR